MSSQDTHTFPPEVCKQLKTYVYRLIDPRDGETFYVGKGTDNRVFAHIANEERLEGDAAENQLDRIRQIRKAGLHVGHVIHRHGMDDATAFEVESALMDAYPGLTNVVGGHGGNDVGSMHAQEIITKYAAPTAEFKHRALLISINRSAAEKNMYEATRYSWKIDPAKALKAEVILATERGLIVAAFVADKWLPATTANFPGHETVEGRYGFVGKPAPAALADMYVRKRIPDEFRKKGAANPIKYTWKK